jgi:hypothetical protein
LAREQRKLAAIIAADVVGYSRLMGRDESGTAGLPTPGVCAGMSLRCRSTAEVTHAPSVCWVEAYLVAFAAK